jgi:hypothetical protein
MVLVGSVHHGFPSLRRLSSDQVADLDAGGHPVRRERVWTRWLVIAHVPTMADQAVTHYMASAQPHYLLAGMPPLKPTGRGISGRVGSAPGREHFLLPAMRGEGARVIVGA